MKVAITPTEELTQVKINGNPVPCRVWVGETDQGTPVELFVLAIIPKDGTDADPAVIEALENELPSFMIKVRKIAAVGDFPKEES